MKISILQLKLEPNLELFEWKWSSMSSSPSPPNGVNKILPMSSFATEKVRKAKLESSVVNRNVSDGWGIENEHNGTGTVSTSLTFDSCKKLCWDVMIVIDIKINVIINSITMICVDLLLQAWILDFGDVSKEMRGFRKHPILEEWFRYTI
ncbi:hypothetical protein BDR06DRAFT_976851 [Suillus hirtellus]|nr:hypothetical protein BDR06DRAFT_976851 [Suillus hirtellus]